MEPPKIGETLGLMVQMAEQGDIAGQCFTDTLIALMSIPDEGLEEYISDMVNELGSKYTEVEGENDTWHFVCDRVIESLGITKVLFEVAKADALEAA